MNSFTEEDEVLEQLKESSLYKYNEPKNNFGVDPLDYLSRLILSVKWFTGGAGTYGFVLIFSRYEGFKCYGGVVGLPKTELQDMIYLANYGHRVDSDMAEVLFSSDIRQNFLLEINKIYGEGYTNIEY